MELPFAGQDQQPVARKPQMAVSFISGGGADGGGLMGAASSVASAVGIDLSSGSVDPWQRSLVEMNSYSCLAPGVDQVKLELVDDSQAPEYALGDTGDIELGYDDDQLYQVFSGQITSIRAGLDRRALLNLCNGAFQLSQLRINQSFEQQTAGDIVQALADLAEVETDSIESGVQLPFYVIDDGKNLYQHIAELAAKSGLIAFMTAENKLNFAGAESGEAKKTFQYAVDLIRIQVVNTTPRVDQLTLTGAGAAGSQGAEAWSWLVKDPQSITASVGEGTTSRILSDGGLRSAEAVQQAAAGKLYFVNQQGSKAKLTVVGEAQVLAGSKIEIAGAPLDTLNGSAIVESARHRYSKRTGFVTELVALMETGDGSGSLLGGLGGLL